LAGSTVDAVELDPSSVFASSLHADRNKLTHKRKASEWRLNIKIIKIVL
jgi:hypothetical protein